jgi:hypothetical protein
MPREPVEKNVRQDTEVNVKDHIWSRGALAPDDVSGNSRVWKADGSSYVLKADGTFFVRKVT